MKQTIVSPGAITKIDNDLHALAKSIGRVVDGNKSTSGASSGQFVVLLNSTISGRSDGLYTASKAIPANTAIDSSYLTASNDGGLNALNSKIEMNNHDLSSKAVFTGDILSLNPGVYRVSNNSTNLPVQNNVYATVTTRNENFKEIFAVSDDGDSFVNVKINGTWSGWQQLALNSKKLNMLHKTTGNGKTFTITFTGNGKSAFMYGRFGYDWSLLSMAVIGHNETGAATIKCFGDQVATVSCSGHVVTVTTAENYANVTVVSDDNIS